MSIVRIINRTVLGSAVAASVIIGSSGTASATPVWCEPAAPYACGGWAAEVEQPQRTEAATAGFTRAQHLKLLSIR